MRQRRTNTADSAFERSRARSVEPIDVRRDVFRRGVVDGDGSSDDPSRLRRPRRRRRRGRGALRACPARPRAPRRRRRLAARMRAQDEELRETRKRGDQHAGRDQRFEQRESTSRGGCEHAAPVQRAAFASIESEVEISGEFAKAADWHAACRDQFLRRDRRSSDAVFYVRLGDRQSHPELRAALWSIGGGNVAVVRHDHLLDDREAQPGAGRLRRRKRLKRFLKRLRREARAVVFEHHAARRRSRYRRARNMRGGHPGALARLQAVAHQVAERPPQQHVVAIDRRRSCPRGRPAAAPGTSSIARGITARRSTGAIVI